MPVTSAKPISVTTMSTIEGLVSVLDAGGNNGERGLTIVLCLVDVCAHGDNAGDTSGVCLGRTSGGSVHDGVLGVAKEIGGSAETVQHAATHHASTVGVGVDVDFNGSVHADNAQSLDDLRGV